VDPGGKIRDECVSLGRFQLFLHAVFCQIPLYVAWFFFMIRFYLMPWLLGYSVMGMLSFPLEGEITRAIFQFFY
jgi:hypothetical protein